MEIFKNFPKLSLFRVASPFLQPNKTDNNTQTNYYNKFIGKQINTVGWNAKIRKRKSSLRAYKQNVKIKKRWKKISSLEIGNEEERGRKFVFISENRINKQTHFDN